MINYDSISGVSVHVSPVTSRTLRSVLTITSVTMSHAGRYSCSPSKVQPDSVIIRVKHREEGPPEPVVNMGKDKRGVDLFIIVIFIIVVVLNYNIVSD